MFKRWKQILIVIIIIGIRYFLMKYYNLSKEFAGLSLMTLIFWIIGIVGFRESQLRTLPKMYIPQWLSVILFLRRREYKVPIAEFVPQLGMYLYCFMLVILYSLNIFTVGFIYILWSHLLIVFMLLVYVTMIPVLFKEVLESNSILNLILKIIGFLFIIILFSYFLITEIIDFIKLW